MAPSTVSSESIDTALIELSPEFLDALRRLVPRRRRAKIPYIVGLGLMAVVAVLAADASTREFVASRWHRGPADAPRQMTVVQAVSPVAETPSIVMPLATTATRVDNPPVPATANVSETTATTKKGHPRRVAPHPAGKHTASTEPE